MDGRRLGSSELEVSRLSLGSWRTFERIPREDGLAVMLAAREHGLNFLDDARYDDETGTAPIPTGYSEVLFGELFRATGWDRADTIVSNKLWWEFWPEQGAAAELDGSLARIGFDYLDLIYANPPPGDLPVAEMVAAVVASFVMAGGVLTGKYGAGQTGRAAGEIGDPRFAAARERGERLRALASELDTSPAALAIAFGLAHPAVATVLFGATSPAQIADNVTALDLDPAVVQRILEI
jgi:aryl-alcohol dehydrogenase-like predicted oxidoreductase